MPASKADFPPWDWKADVPLKKARLRISDYRDNRKALVNNTERKIRSVSLSLTSMVDMFAILVIFLLSSQDSVNHMLDTGHAVQLPKAKTSAPPPQGIALEISPAGIYAHSEKLLAIENVQSQDPKAMSALTTWLSKQLQLIPAEETAKRLNLVADERLPYGTVRRVVALARRTGFTELNLAVEPRP